MTKLSEIDVAAGAIAWLREREWDVFQEVQVRSYGQVADIVAVQEGRVWVIECKTSFGLDVIAQAHGWAHYAHWTSVAVPDKKRSRTAKFGEHVCQKLGIGVIKSHGSEWAVSETVCAALNRKARAQTILAALSAEHRTFAEAGTNSGKRWSPWRETCVRLQRFVRANPGVSLRKAIDSIDHHYRSNSSARGSMSKWVREGKVDGIRLAHKGRTPVLFPR